MSKQLTRRVKKCNATAGRKFPQGEDDRAKFRFEKKLTGGLSAFGYCISLGDAIKVTKVKRKKGKTWMIYFTEKPAITVKGNATTASTSTEPVITTKTVYRYCTHSDWLTVGAGRRKYRVFLKSSSGHIPGSLDVFVSMSTYGLTTKSDREIPPELEKYLPPERVSKTKIVYWYVPDGAVDGTLVKFVVNMILDGLSVGWGCIGGHGRTGWLAAKVHQILSGCSGLEAIKHIRQNYCDDAIETDKQIEDLGANPILVGTRKWWGGRSDWSK